MKNKLTVIIATILFFNFAFAQQKGILLSSKIDDETEFYKENKRVKIETNDGKKYTGRIKIIDKKNISIDDEIIAIDTIIKIRSQSLFSALFFILLIMHVQLRDELAVNTIVYMEYFYLISYITILMVTVNAVLLLQDTPMKVLAFKDNLIPKLIYWPILLVWIFIITAILF